MKFHDLKTLDTVGKVLDYALENANIITMFRGGGFDSYEDRPDGTRLCIKVDPGMTRASFTLLESVEDCRRATRESIREGRTRFDNRRGRKHFHDEYKAIAGEYYPPRVIRLDRASKDDDFKLLR